MSRTISVSDQAYEAIAAAASMLGQSPEAFVEQWASQHEHDPAQAWFWTPEWQAGERRATAELHAGEGEYFDDEEQFLAALDDDADV